MGVEDGAVVAAAEGVADFAEGGFGELAGEVHGDLAGEGDVGGAAFAGHVREADVEVLGDAGLDLIDGDGAARFLLEEVLEQVLEALLGSASGRR